MAEKMTDDQVRDALNGVPGWRRDGDAIARDFEFDDFVGALGFIAQVGVLAERANHHPNLSNVYNRVGIALSTHDAGGITQQDFDLAKEINARA